MGKHIYKRKHRSCCGCIFLCYKIKWILDNVEGVREKAGKREKYGIWNSGHLACLKLMTNGKVHVTDYTNASRTMLLILEH